MIETNGGDKDHFERLVFLFFGILLLATVGNRLLAYLSYIKVDGDVSFWASLVAFLQTQVWPYIKIAAVVIVILTTFGIAYNLRGLKKVRLKEKAIYGAPPPLGAEDVSRPKNDRWEKVIENVNSDNESNWRAAIIEADVMLGELLQTLNYKGESIGEMLKGVDLNEFSTLDDAWAAHKVRNQIAHAGSGYKLSSREAKTAIRQFENVFKEFRLV